MDKVPSALKLTLAMVSSLDDDVLAGPKWKGKGRASDMDVFN
jgi:hypothetical protein